ncbi:MAG: hypothetical protein R3299_03950 [Arenibacter sp.]|nr:hypothetical protein [Arenibacter sp.]
MPIQNDDFLNNRKKVCNASTHIVGLEKFRKRLEKDFYANINISSYWQRENDAHLSIEFSCNFSLSEALYFLQYPMGLPKDTPKQNPKKTTLFHEAYSELLEVNEFSMDISELSIVLTDTNILISRIYEQSIVHQLEEIANELDKHTIYYTKGLSDTPYEIFIPVFEQPDPNPLPQSLDVRVNNTPQPRDYFYYWGMYFGSAEKAAVYDLSTQKLIKGDVQIF